MIGRPIRNDWRAKTFVDLQTGEALDEEETKRYIQRHNERRDTARRADKLVAMVGRYNPCIEAELRIYMGKFPWKVADLLEQAKQVFKKAMEKDALGEQSAPTKKKKKNDKKHRRLNTDSNAGKNAADSYV